MKRCPECYRTYDASEKFCEMDGEPLLIDPVLSVPDVDEASSGPTTHRLPKTQPSGFSQQREIWLVGTAGAVLGVVVCVGGYLAYGLWTDDSGYKESSAPAFVTQTQNAIQPPRPPVPSYETTTPPEETATVEPEASPAQESAPADKGETVAAPVNEGPISTGQRSKVVDDRPALQTIIQMNDGTAVEVDAAWEDQQGVWYRRGGMVVFVESQRVKAITGRAAQRPASASPQ